VEVVFQTWADGVTLPNFTPSQAEV